MRSTLTRRLAPVTLAMAGVLLSLVATPATAATTEPSDTEVDLARLSYRNGVTVTFTRDTQSRDFGMQQDGQVNRNGPVASDEAPNLISAYLAITPRTVPVPAQLIEELPAGTPRPAELQYRQISSTVVIAGDLTVPGTSTQSTVTCWTAYYDPYHWYDLSGYPNPGSVFHGAEDYYSSSFGGMAMYSKSFVVACAGPARHRIYYKDFGTYKKHHDKTVPDDHWQAKTKGSVHRYRKVLYDAGAGYTRNGRYVG